MKKQSIRGLAACLALLLIFCQLPVHVLAADDPPVTVSDSDQNTYEVTKTSITSYNLGSDPIPIPAIYAVKGFPSNKDIVFSTTNNSVIAIADGQYQYTVSVINGSAVLSLNTEKYFDVNYNLNAPKFSNLSSYVDTTKTVLYVEFSSDTNNYIGEFGLLIELGAAAAVDKSALQSAISSAPTSGYYTENDRYNGKITSTNGFWSDYQTALAEAKAVSENEAASKAQVDNAVTALESAIANLIPSSQVNPTALYEPIQKYTTGNRGYYETDEERPSNGTGGKGGYLLSDYTDASANNYRKALEAAQTFLKDLFDTDGTPTQANKAENQAQADELADALTGAVDELLRRSNGPDPLAYIPALYQLTAGAAGDSSGTYTQESLSALVDARSKAYSLYTQYYGRDGGLLASQYREIQTAWEAFFDAYHLDLKNAADSITVHVRTADSLALKYPKEFSDTVWTPWQGDIQLTGDQTVAGLMKALGDKIDVESDAQDMKASYGVFINGVLAASPAAFTATNFNFYDYVTEGGVGTNRTLSYMLHDGDEVAIARMPNGKSSYYGWDGTVALLYSKDYVGTSRFTDANGTPLALAGLKVTEGEPFDLYVEKTLAALGAYDGRYTPFSNAVLYASPEGAGATDSPNSAAAPLYNTGFTADSSGKLTVTLYGSGWVNLYALDTREDIASESVGGSVSITQLPTLITGASLWVYVEPKTGSDLSAALADQLQAAEDCYNALDMDMFTAEQLETINNAYQEARGIITAPGATLTDAKNAVLALKEDVETLLAKVEQENATKLNLVTFSLNLLPTAEQVANGQFTKGDIERYQYLAANYDQLTEYQKGLLTGAQVQQYEALTAAYGEDGSTLPDARYFTVTVKLAEACDPARKNDFLLGNKAAYLIGFNGGYLASASTLNHYGAAVPFMGSFDDPFSALYGTDYTLEVATNFIDNPTACSTYEVYKVEVDGAEFTVSTTAAADYSPTIQDNKQVYLYYMYEGRPVGENYMSKATVSLSNVSSDEVTITLYIRSIDDPKSLDEQKADARAELAAVYQGYSKASYTTAGWTSLTEAYNSGLAAIDAAADESGITAAINSAKTAMAAVPTRAQEQAQNPSEDKNKVGELGSVTVTVTNNTYSGAPDGWTGTFIEEQVALNKDTTMMTALLAALDRNGYTWTGTGGSTSGGTDITYIASISKGGYTLAEFTGGQKSGWMGTLNDWFTNEGFSSFTASAANSNYRIVDGDVIDIQYTCDLGVDLGGGWGNSDTSLSGWTVTGGSLSPAFSGTTTGYTLVLNGRSVTVTPTAANKNYQVRTYINEQSGSNWYRRGEVLPVKAGDTIYVGVGGAGWPSMNSNPGYEISFDPTWYAINVVDSSSSAAVVDMIKGLSSVTYSNYKTQAEKAAQARAAYENLTTAAKAEVTNLSTLTAAEAQITFYREIDNVKDLLSALPNSGKATDDQVKAAKSKIEAADAAYKALSDDQKAYITVADAANYNALVERLGKLTTTSASSISGSQKAPEEIGETGGGAITLTPEAKTDKNGEAAVQLKAETIDKTLEQAAEDSSISTIVVAPEITGDPSKVSVELPKTAVSSIAANSDLDLTVSTPIADMTLTNEGLAELGKQNGRTVTISAEAVKDEKGKATGAVKVEVAVNSKPVESIPGGITVSIPGGDSAGNVLAQVQDDGAETIIKKSIVEKDGSYKALLPGCATVKIIDNSKTFTDVSDSYWAKDSIDFVASRELLQGSGNGAFAPAQPMTRAMLVTMLYRLESGKAEGGHGFQDVAEDAWYTDPVTWASGNQIVNGISADQFAPDQNITREQLAAMMYRYAKFLNMDTSTAGDLKQFGDKEKVSSWAEEAVTWAVGAGLMNGRGENILDPAGTATRAEVAAIMQRMITLILR